MGYRMGEFFRVSVSQKSGSSCGTSRAEQGFFCLFVLVNFVLMKICPDEIFLGKLVCTLINRETTMARIAGVNLPAKKRVEVALTYIYGIGPTKAREIRVKAEIEEARRVHELKRR